LQEPLLEIRGLKVNFYTYGGIVRALDGIDLEVMRGETVGLVGETGSGKSVTALSIIRLVADPPGKIDGGQILLNGEDLLQKREQEMQKIRGAKIAMVFQDPSTFLNPVMTVGDQLTETLKAHNVVAEPGLKGRALKRRTEEKAAELLKQVRMPDPEGTLKKYPHELSGGMRQRVMIAMAIACQPALLIADEPTTALDVTIQSQILDLLGDLKEEEGLSVLLITHDLGIVSEICDRVAVMYAGNIVEVARTLQLFEDPLHPYTQALLNAVPRIDDDRQELENIKGSVPNLITPPTGCRFHPRCPYVMDVCTREKPELLEAKEGHSAACFLVANDQKEKKKGEEKESP
jgi:peptide/nickel transport system ATP-binding protein